MSGFGIQIGRWGIFRILLSQIVSLAINILGYWIDPSTLTMTDSGNALVSSVGSIVNNAVGFVAAIVALLPT